MMLVPSLCPQPPINIFTMNRQILMPSQKKIGPRIRPSCAREAPMVAKRGARQNWDRESPIPAMGPISAILIPLISLGSAPPSSILKCRLVMNGAILGLVLKNSILSFNTSFNSSSSEYIFRREGYSILA